MIRHPVAGNMLAYLHYVLGLERLGHRVVYIEESGWPNSCYDPVTANHSSDPTTGIARANSLLRRAGSAASLLFVDRESGEVSGGDADLLSQELASADALINVGGVNWLPGFRRARRLGYIDMDPAFTQAGKFGLGAIAEHDVHFSYGMNIGTRGCTIPADGVTWHGTVPPVVTDLWTGAADDPSRAILPDEARFTTIANWSAYGEVTIEGRELGQKNREFLRLGDVPARSAAALEIALAGADSGDAARLRSYGWAIRDASRLDEVAEYERYIRSSLGEFSVAKEAYVATRSGWFSDRSVCYLAAGRPVVLQDTGFSDWLEQTGTGVLAFEDAAGALAALADVSARYDSHSAAARRIAGDVFGHEIVLPSLLQRMGIE